MIDVLFGFRARAQRRKGAVEELRNKKQKIRNKEVELKYFRNPQPFELIELIEPFEHDIPPKPRKHQKPLKRLVRIENFQPLQLFPLSFQQ